MYKIAIVLGMAVLAVFGCKTKQQVVKYDSPHTDTIKMAVSYQQDSLEVFVKKIIVSDSLFGLKETVDFDVVDATQNDSLLVLTLRSYNGCTAIDFDLYQSDIVLKTYPPRLRARIAKTQQSGCDESSPLPRAFTVVFDIKPILADYTEAHILFANSPKIVTLKRK